MEDEEENDAEREAAIEEVITWFMSQGMDREEATKAFRQCKILDVLPYRKEEYRSIFDRDD